MKKTHLFSCIVILTFFSHSIHAQSWDLGIGLNAMNYQGDVMQPALFTLKET